jgi:hypothetical protein
LPTFAFSTPVSFVFASFEKNFESLQKLYVALKKSKRSRGKLIFVVARETQTKKSQNRDVKRKYLRRLFLRETPTEPKPRSFKAQK